MKYLSQFGIIVTISFIGELLNKSIPLPIPASIYGMCILFIGLVTGIIRPAYVKETAKFMIEIMPLMFIPATVGLIESWNIMQNFVSAIIIISLASTITVAVISGHVTQYIITRKNKKKKGQ